MATITEFKDIPGVVMYANPINTTPDTVLKHATGKLSKVLIIGFDKITDNIYIASSSDDMTENNFLIDIAKKRLLEQFKSE